MHAYNIMYTFYLQLKNCIHKYIHIKMYTHKMYWWIVICIHLKSISKKNNYLSPGSNFLSNNLKQKIAYLKIWYKSLKNESKIARLNFL